MSHVTPQGRGTVPGGLRLLAVLEERGISKAAFARSWAAATGGETASKRRQVTTYTTKGGTNIGDDNAELFSRLLELPVDYFKTPRDGTAERRDRLAAVEEEVADLKRALVVARKATKGILERVEALEAQASARSRRAGRSTPRGARGQ